MIFIKAREKNKMNEKYFAKPTNMDFKKCKTAFFQRTDEVLRIRFKTKKTSKYRKLD